jgi:hypothetical protein
VLGALNLGTAEDGELAELVELETEAELYFVL